MLVICWEIFHVQCPGYISHRMTIVKLSLFSIHSIIDILTFTAWGSTLDVKSRFPHGKSNMYNGLKPIT